MEEPDQPSAHSVVAADLTHQRRDGGAVEYHAIAARSELLDGHGGLTADMDISTPGAKEDLRDWT
ncbi:hypothetical protein ASG32_31700 [Methylobacterium sp. Leaf361]|nr:hypothetical protein ASG32_31700 [Methylobacterium sp. Leaf361]